MDKKMRNVLIGVVALLIVVCTGFFFVNSKNIGEEMESDGQAVLGEGDLVLDDTSKEEDKVEEEEAYEKDDETASTEEQPKEENPSTKPEEKPGAQNPEDDKTKPEDDKKPPVEEGKPTPPVEEEKPPAPPKPPEPPKPEPITGIAFSAFEGKLTGLGWTHSIKTTYDYLNGGNVEGMVRATSSGAYFSIFNNSQAFGSVLTKSFDLLLPSQGSKLYSIVSSGCTNQTLKMAGRNVLIEVYGSEIQISITN